MSLEGAHNNIACQLCDDHCGLALVPALITAASGQVTVGRRAMENPYIVIVSSSPHWCASCCWFAQLLMLNKSCS